MNKNSPVLLTTLFLGILLSAGRFPAETGLTVSEKQFVTPVLTGKTENPIVRLTVTVPEQRSENETTTFTFDSQGTTRIADIAKARLYYCGTDSVLNTALTKKTAVLFGETATINRQFSINGKQTLKPGVNYFWLSYELKKTADLMGYVDATCEAVNVASERIKPQQSPNVVKQRIGVALRQHNDENVHTYRIPGLATTNNGTLLAIYDARRGSARDLQGDIDIGVSRSTDGGTTWEPMRIALDKGTWGNLPQKFNGVSDPCILVDRNSKTIYVAGLWMHGVLDDQGKWIEGLNEASTSWNHQWRNKGSQPGFDVKQTSQFLLTKSTDDGKTWSEPVNLTQMCKKEDWWLWAPAPGAGITLADGTLVFPTQGREPDGRPFSNITYSKDGGKTWATSPKASSESTTENMAVQLSDGSVMLNMRANKNRGNLSASNGRVIAVTNDLGKIWREHPSSSSALPEPTCMGSIHRHDYTVGGKNRSLLLFVNPNSKTDRDHITLKVSFDNGKTWPQQHWILLDELKGRGYSCITSVNEKTVGIVYESSQADLVFQKIKLDELIK
ncbi:exo-alpha-sialidase [Spirosoma sp. BT702]|uniref:exo-alpha-sialidase n=1 Tax=Spirosoma profusum TaxID=2771354 RepID=A0A926Y3Y0_9BACT|nr:sialidase family protein [Spirosoma profusum]MBD2703833.1 exo-alpha-sialidase [Spirosoma profusum]